MQFVLFHQSHKGFWNENNWIDNSWSILFTVKTYLTKIWSYLYNPAFLPVVSIDFRKFEVTEPHTVLNEG